MSDDGAWLWAWTWVAIPIYCYFGQDVEVEVLQTYWTDDQNSKLTFYRRGHRFVTKRPSWEPRPAWSLAQQTSIEMHARRLAKKKEDDYWELQEYYREIDGY